MFSLLNPVSEPDGWARFYTDMRFLKNPLRMGREHIPRTVSSAGKTTRVQAAEAVWNYNGSSGDIEQKDAHFGYAACREITCCILNNI